MGRLAVGAICRDFDSCKSFQGVGSGSSSLLLRSRSYTDGAPPKHQSAITGSQIAHPNEESAANGTMGFP
jgi:hypothetical protein